MQLLTVTLKDIHTGKRFFFFLPFWKAKMWHKGVNLNTVGDRPCQAFCWPSPQSSISIRGELQGAAIPYVFQDAEMACANKGKVALLRFPCLLHQLLTHVNCCTTHELNNHYTIHGSYRWFLVSVHLAYEDALGGRRGRSGVGRTSPEFPDDHCYSPAWAPCTLSPCGTSPEIWRAFGL